MFYRVQYCAVDNIVLFEDVEIVGSADIGFEIANKIGINRNQVIKHSRLFGKVKSVVKDDDIAIILSSLIATNGRQLHVVLADTLREIYPKNKNLDKQLKQWRRQNLTLIQMLVRLNIDPTVITLVESGMQGDMPKALLNADNYFNLKIKTKEAANVGFLGSIAMMFFSLVMILSIPNFATPILNNFLSFTKKEANFVINLLNYIDHYIVYILAIVLCSIIFLVYSSLNKQAYNLVKKYPPWSMFERLKQFKNVLAFLPLYSTLNKAGVIDKDIVKAYGRIDHDISSQLFSFIDGDKKTLSEAIVMSDMSDEFSTQVSMLLGVEQGSTRDRSIHNFVDSFTKKTIRHATKTSKFLKIVSYVFIGIAILFVLGILFTTSTMAF